jgi:N6-adenosine-specific RNA methylase IME4
MARRTVHSRKPFAFRELIERVSPGPYLELYGREEQPRTEWTVYGNQVERRLF